MMDDGLRTENQGTPLRPLLPWLLLSSALSVTMMVLGAGRDNRTLTGLAAGLLASLVVGTALGINAPLWSKSKSASATHAATMSALRCNMWLAAVVYAWGASALFAMYSLSDLSWRHPFQYATGASVFAIGIALYGVWLGRAQKAALPPLSLSLLHGAAAGGGLVYLIGAEKLSTVKDDWAANEVFLWGGFAIVALCAFSGLTQTRGARR